MENAVKEMFNVGEMFKKNNEKIVEIKERFSKELQEAYAERLIIIKRHEEAAKIVDEVV